MAQWRGGRLAVVMLLLVAANRRVANAQVFGSPLALNSDATADDAYDAAPCFASDAPGRWVAVWDASSRFGFDRDVIVSRSLDGGVTWTAPAPLNTDATTDDSYDNDSRPRIASDGSTFVTAWTSSFHGVRIAVSHDAGTTWSVPASIDLLPRSPGIAFADVATDRLGKWVVVWGDTLTGNQAIWASRSVDAGATWSPAVVVSGLPDSQLLLDGRPRVASDGSAWVAVWGQRRFPAGTASLMSARSLDGGTWFAPAPVSPSGQGAHANPDVAGSPGGGWVVAWMSTDTLGGSTTSAWHVFASRSSDGGAGWSFPVILDPDLPGGAGAENQPSLASDPTGRWVAAWIGQPLAARTALSPDGGASWTTPTNASPGSAFSPHVETDGSGTWLLGWDTFGMGSDHDIFVTRGVLCGDGLVASGEDCDEGELNGAPTACCAFACAFQPIGTACDGGTCDGTGTCVSSSTSSTTTSTTLCPDLDGDAVCDPDDNCSAVGNVDQQDADGDGLGDDCDPCTNVGRVREAREAKITALRLLPPAGDDILRISGVITVPTAPAIDPVRNGLRILYGDNGGAAEGNILDEMVPPGPYDPTTRRGWIVANARFAFVDRTGTSGVRKVSLRASAPGEHSVRIRAWAGDYAGNPGALPVHAVVVLDPPYARAGHCGEWHFTAAPPTRPSCVLNAAGSAVKCR